MWVLCGFASFCVCVCMWKRNVNEIDYCVEGYSTIVHCVPHLSGKPINPTWRRMHIHTQYTWATHSEDTAGGKIKLIKLTDKSSCARERKGREEVGGGAAATAKSLGRGAGPISSVQRWPSVLHRQDIHNKKKREPKCLSPATDLRLHFTNEQCKVWKPWKIMLVAASNYLQRKQI